MANAVKSYWYDSPRGFANEYHVAIATTKTAADHYEACGYGRISRARALRELTNRGDAATKIYATVEVDNNQQVSELLDRFAVARRLRDGKPL